jgi:putative tryptophan/tyrosine transport system substrate-binding protein
LVIPLVGCNPQGNNTHRVGVINIVPDFDQILIGFKKGMTELGYIEGDNIRYFYEGPTTDLTKLSAAAQSLLANKVDLLLTMTTPATLAAKKATAGIGPPIVFVPVTDPVGAGIVESMKTPGGQITGIAFGVQETRRLEWLLRLAPKIRSIYIPFNPRDKSPVLAVKMVQSAAARLGVELVAREVDSPAALDEAVSNIPAQADAVFLLPDSLLSTRLTDLVNAATQSHLPVSGANIMVVRNNHVLTSFGFDQHLCGRQAARLADQIFKGAKPAELPVEMAEFYLAINLKVAKAIGLTIPDEILRHAHIIVR